MDAKGLTDAEIRATMSSEQILLERKLTCEAIDGAMAFGYQDTNPPPSDDHWLMPFWKIGRKQAELEALAALPSDVAQAPVTPQPAAWMIDWPDEPELGHYFGEEPNSSARSVPLYAAPVAPQAAGDAVPVPLTDELRTAIQAAADTAHRVLCAGGDYGDELSDAGLRRELKESRDMLRTMLAAALVAPAVVAPSIDPFAQLLAKHAQELDQNEYAYFELAYTRRTGWMAWICSNHRDDDPERKVLARGQGSTPQEACANALGIAAPTPTVAADVAVPLSLLTAEHKGMRVDYSGVFKQATAALARGGKEPGLAEMLRQMKEHITELGTRWYAGDTAVVDELLQLYCVEKDARDALVAAAGAAQ